MFDDRAAESANNELKRLSGGGEYECGRNDRKDREC